MPIVSLMKKILSILKSLWFNFKYLPLKQALKLPVVLTYNTRIVCNGKVVLESKNITFAMIRIGFHKVPVCNDNDITSIIVEEEGRLYFKGSAHIGNGSKIYVADSAILSLGDNFAISASSALNCYYKIIFGRDIQFSWNCLVMDSDTHKIFDKEGRIVNPDKPITFGDKVWIGCNCMILKGSNIPSNSVIGANSVVSGGELQLNTVIVGSPARSIKEIGGWEL